MAEFARPQGTPLFYEDFEIEGRLGRCKICIQGGPALWTKLGNLRAHETLKIHKDNVAQAILRDSQLQGVDAGKKRRWQAYVEDCPDDDPPPRAPIPWFTSPAFEDDSFATGPSVTAQPSQSTMPVRETEAHTRHLPLEMQDALSGGVDFSSADLPTPQGASDITLEDVLSGAGLLDAVMNFEDEESPPAPSVEDQWAVEDQQATPERPIPSATEISEALFGSSTAPPDVFPYPDAGMLKTDILFSSPTIRFSRSQKEAILAWGKEMGAREVPSLYGLDKFQLDALESVGDPTEKIHASSGNVFYMNSIYQALARDYAHPERRRKMRLFPEFTDGRRIQEAWHASKWLVDAPDDILTPMTRVRGKDFFVNELTFCTDKSWFIPTRFFDFEGGLWAKGRRATESKVPKDKISVLPCSSFHSPWPEIEARARDKNIFTPECAHFASLMPHPTRALAGGLEVECPPLIIFIDDVSGNSSKQWNVHYSCYVSNASLPRAELEKDGNIRFVATSPHASPMEIIRAICESLKKGVAKPFQVWDSVKKRPVLICPWILLLPGDNPMQAELCSHIGLQGNHFCRMCHSGGDHTFKASNDGFASLMVPGRARTVSETREAIMAQLMLATHAAGEKPVKNAITASGVKDSFAMPVLNQLIAKGKILRRATTTRKALTPEMVNKELYEELMKKMDVPLCNPLLEMGGLDVHLDTPVEPLHTHLLGVVKYFWSQTVWVLEKQNRFAEFQTRLNSLSRLGLKIPNIMADYMCRYRGALIGKHFKTISQVMAFAICGLVDVTLQDAWSSIGYLTVLIWETEITDIKVYTKELRTVIQETIDFAAALSPGLLTEKNKFHILAHLPDHIERFGPALLFSTERYESFNHIFRLCSIHSNRQAPSRDIAKTFANQDRCRHMVSGGYWLNKATGEWVQAGNGVLQHIAEHTIDARLLGLTPEKTATPGEMTLLPLPPRRPGQPPPQHPLVSWAHTESARILPPLIPLDGEWNRAASVVTESGDSACVGSEVVVRETGLDSGMSSTTEITPNNHDCTSGQCSATGTQRLRQEREDSTRTRQVIQHSDTVNYVLNLTALHNQAYMRSSLPAALRTRPTFFDDRAALHKRAAESLRDTKLQKKLAREAVIRRSAESALRATTTNAAGANDVLNLALTDSALDTALGPSDDLANTMSSSTSENAARVSPGTPALQPTSHDAMAAPPATSLAAPRGPRQRKGPARLSGTSARSAAAGSGSITIQHAQLDVRMAADVASERRAHVGCATAGEGEPSRSEVPPTGSASLLVCPGEPPSTSGLVLHTLDTSPAVTKTAPPAPKRRKVRATADPEATAARETMFRAMFK
ncbi:hypothetical protein TRAPUB_2102 [Trametes pubescens]|uniref:Uncharacterized protein n=1 Tax=Trametes pubescens TaxID=154538 RepID=A0A1M2VHJ6_TRAPU|nr:hypothetical protein TRAPUB_2102 [Trametes pubescens]